MFIFYNIFHLSTVLSKSKKLLNTFSWLYFFNQPSGYSAHSEVCSTMNTLKMEA